MEFLKAYSSESESEFGQEECDDSERSESPVRDLNESAVRQVYLVTYTQAIPINWYIFPLQRPTMLGT